MRRDSQRAKLYRAEHVVKGERLDTVAEIEAYVARVQKRARLLRRYPILDRWPIEVRDGRGRRKAGARRDAWLITMPVWSRCEGVVLHEVAHLLTPSHVAAHGWEFAEALLVLIREMQGPEAAKRLVASFREHGVRWKPTRKRQPLSPEQRAAACERLAAARQARALKAVDRLDVSGVGAVKSRVDDQEGVR